MKCLPRHTSTLTSTTRSPWRTHLRTFVFWPPPIIGPAETRLREPRGQIRGSILLPRISLHCRLGKIWKNHWVSSTQGSSSRCHLWLFKPSLCQFPKKKVTDVLRLTSTSCRLRTFTSLYTTTSMGCRPSTVFCLNIP